MEHVEYEQAIKAYLDAMLAGKAFSVPRLNTPSGKLLQRYALIRIAKARIEKMHEEARTVVLKHCAVDSTPGTYPVYDSPHIFAQAVVRNGARRLDEGSVVELLKERLDIGEQEAQALVEKCKSGGALPTIQFTVTLKK